MAGRTVWVPVPAISYYSGRVHSVVFGNAAKAFYILRIVLDAESVTTITASAGSTVTVRGDVPGMKVGVGTWFGFEGVWDDHPQYGRQIKITRAPMVKSDWDADTCEKILVSNGVGHTIAASLKAHFGSELAEALLDPEKIRLAPGLTKFTALHVHSRWQTARAQFISLDFLNKLGLPQGRIRQVWSHFGDSAEEVLASNPWALVQLDGFTFSDADNVAGRLHLDCSAKNRLRLKGAVLYAARSGKGFGHLFVTSGEMLGTVRAIDTEFADGEIAKAIKSSLDKGLIVLDRTTEPGTTAIYDPWSHCLESESARALARRVTQARLTPDQEGAYLQALAGDANPLPTTLAAGVRYALARIEAVGSIALSGLQIQGIVHALCEPVSILSGLPGTGKTTSLRMAVLMLQEAGIPFLLLAPTGIAAKRISSVTGAPASTIHRAFKATGSSDTDRESTYAGVVGDSEGGTGSNGLGEDWGFGVGAPHPAQVVIVDESSMLDQHLLYRILLCTRPDARLVFVGDAAQLPSVGPGNVLRDLIASRIFPTVALTEIFRQSDTSPIIHAAHAVYRGEVPEAPVGSDFSLLEVSDEDKVADLICSISYKLYEQRRNFQVLSPRHSGPVGVTTLNSRLRELINPKQPTLREMKLGMDVLREDDRIMVVKNDYKLGVFNGDVGKLVSIDRKNKEVEIKVHGPPVLHVKIPFDKVPTVLRLAYAVTVHKCVHPDTLVETSEGLLPIKAIQATGRIATPTASASYHNLVHNAEDVALTVTVAGGYSLTSTPDHGLDVWDGSDYVRKEARDVREGDVLRLPLGVGCDVASLADLPTATLGDGGEVQHLYPKWVTPEVAEFLGLMVADGTVFDRGFRLAKRHEDVANHFAALCEKLFRVTPKQYFKLGAHHVEVESTFLVRWLRSLGGLTPNQKGVPECISRSPERVQRAFLRGLFEGGTVSLKDRGGSKVVDSISWGNKSVELARVVAVMLLRANIVSSLKTRTRVVRGRTTTLTTLSVYSGYIEHFRRSIGFISGFKRERTELPVRPSEGYGIPLSEGEARLLRREHKDVLGRASANNLVNRRWVTLAVLSRLDAVHTPLLERLRTRSTEFHHARVLSVDATRCETMCVTVPDGHQFRQSGFSGWNCQGLEYDCIVMPVVNSFAHQLQRNLFYTAITRARKKVVLVGTQSAVTRAVMNERESARNTLLSARLLGFLGSVSGSGA